MMRRRGFVLLGAAYLLAMTVPARADTKPVPSGSHPSQAQSDETPVNTRFLLVDHNKRPVTDEFYRGRFMLMAFGFVSCPDVCPTTMAEMAAVLAKLGERANRVHPLFVSVDPERDTPEVLREYTRAFDPRITGLTGSAEMIAKVAEHYHVRYAKISEPGAPKGAYTMDHTAGMFLVGPAGEFIARFAYSTPTDRLVERITTYLDAAPAQPR